MTTGQAILLDHVVALLSVAAWFATGAAVALGRVRLGLRFMVTAAMVTLAQVATVAILAGAGWWFVEEKALLGLPMVTTAGLAAVLIAGRPLLEAQRTPGMVPPPSCVVAPLTAAYAGLAGLAVTFLAGYPLTWGRILVTASLVCGSALLTSRVVAASTDDATGATAESPDPELAPDERPGISRRLLLRGAGGAAVVGAGATGVGLSFRPAASITTGGPPARPAEPHPQVSVADLRGALSPAPGRATRRHVLTARSATVRLPSGRELDAWTYAGQVPGPAIIATEGDLIEVRLRNADIEGGVTLHWHGYDVACGEDGAPGVTQRVVEPGEEFVYHFRADQVGTYWYHTHQTSHIGVRQGLYGTLVVHPRQQQEQGLDLTLPVHTFNDVVVIGDHDGRIERTTAPGTPVRLRLINTDSDSHRLALAGTPFRVTALDGRDLNEPDEVAEAGLRLAAGGRHDLVFDMPPGPVLLVLDGPSENGVLLRPDDATSEPDVPDTSGWPELDLLTYGAPSILPFDPDAADRHFTLVLDRGLALVDGRPRYAQTVNGLAHPSIPDQLVAEGDVVRFTIVNRSLETHPWHLHGHPVLVLSRDGRRSSGSPLWMDTFDVRPGEVWEVAFEATNPGMWMNHCHNLPHAAEGMMLRLCYDGVTTPFGDAHTDHG